MPIAPIVLACTSMMSLSMLKKWACFRTTMVCTMRVLSCGNSHQVHGNIRVVHDTNQVWYNRLSTQMLRILMGVYALESNPRQVISLGRLHVWIALIQIPENFLAIIHFFSKEKKLECHRDKCCLQRRHIVRNSHAFL